MLETWVSELKDSFAVKKEHLLGSIAELEATQKRQATLGCPWRHHIHVQLESLW